MTNVSEAFACKILNTRNRLYHAYRTHLDLSLTTVDTCFLDNFCR
uniref:Uncharacterized protein n=1 Tax=Arundo donax TaxID=35708 RepID=A0A0A8YEG8_ARUDO